MVNGNPFGKTICSICYEDLQPIVEDLQAISICGHVFHELCLQQWFEYCSSTKKCTCPVCKQSCKANDAARLYFQSIGDSVADPSLAPTQRPISDSGDDPEALRREVRRLEAKVLGFDSVLERQGKDLKVLNQELCLCKEQEKKETALKNEALKQKALLQQLLNVKTEELSKSTMECSRLQERNMALAKELAALKLVSDLDLDGEEVLKLASFGNGANSQDTVDILRRSLVMRNKSYKELMAKCNLLGRGESRSTQKLEKAKGKIDKLKARVKELEIAVEVKDNKVLRELKASKKPRCEGVIKNGVNCESNYLPNIDVSEGQSKQSSATMLNLDKSGRSQDDLLHHRKVQNSNSANEIDVHCSQDGPSTMARNKEEDDCTLIGVNISKSYTAVQGLPNPDSKGQTTEDVVTPKSFTKTSNATYDTKKQASVHQCSNLAGPFSSRISVDKTTKSFAADIDEDVTVLFDDVAQVKPMLNIRKESPTPLSNPGDICFSGGLLGPDGTNRYLGKWCKRHQNKETRQGVNRSSTGDLIAVGADGRGGRIKVLRSLNQSSMDNKENSVGAKRCKVGPQKNSQQSRGCLQIEHFFGRVSN
ncbi:43kDa postsynaptic protein [Parasponia andersonii]|uniref:43kDa postsynaptic protein n=1 Tax=Parasponia andersonii TaxID=3476 RepID=A0A2P5D465_PARAD|nr:43kDa postsynaptic protein [Parasponia andersonii]